MHRFWRLALNKAECWSVTMPNHMRALVAEATSLGVILIPQRFPVADAIDLLLLACEAAEPEDIENRICLLPSLAMYGF